MYNDAPDIDHELLMRRTEEISAARGERKCFQIQQPVLEMIEFQRRIANNYGHPNTFTRTFNRLAGLGGLVAFLVQERAIQIGGPIPQASEAVARLLEHAAEDLDPEWDLYQLLRDLRDTQREKRWMRLTAVRQSLRFEPLDDEDPEFLMRLTEKITASAGERKCVQIQQPVLEMVEFQRQIAPASPSYRNTSARTLNRLAALGGLVASLVQEEELASDGPQASEAVARILENSATDPDATWNLDQVVDDLRDTDREKRWMRMTAIRQSLFLRPTG